MLSRDKALKEIKKTDLKKIRAEIFLSLEEAFQADKEELAGEFLRCLKRACENISVRQDKGTLGKVRFIVLTVLRTRIVQKNYRFPIMACGPLWWLDDSHCAVGEYDCSYIFWFYEKMKQRLEQERKKYIGKTVKQDVDSLMNDELRNFLYYIGRIVRYKIAEAVQTDYFARIKTDEEIQIHVGEYFDFSEVIYIQSRAADLLDDAAKQTLFERITQKKREKFWFADLRGAQLEQTDLVESDFRFADLGNSALKNADIRYSQLMGTVFNNCNLQKADLSYSVLCDASFKNADCRGAKFQKIIAYAGLEDPKYWDMIGFYPLDFTNANLQGADFSGANIRGAIFTEADLTQTVFDRSQLSYLNLTNEQQRMVKQGVS